MTRLLTIASYLVVALAAVVLGLLARRPDDRVPSLGTVVTWAMRRRSTQLGLLFAWWWLGWHFVTAR